MSTQGVSLNGLTFNSVQDIDAALKAKQIDKKQAKALKALFPKSGRDLGKGVSLQASNALALTPKQQEQKAQANKAALDEVAKAKEQATTADKTAQVKKDGVTTEFGVISSHGEGTAYTFDVKAPTKKMEKTTKDQERARLARYYDEKSGKWIERGEEYKTNKDVNKALRAKEKEIKAEFKAQKKAAKELNKAAQKSRKAADKADLAMDKIDNTASNKEKLTKTYNKYAEAAAAADSYEEQSIQAAEKQMKAKEELEQVHQARKASQRTSFLRNTGVGADKRAYNNNVEAYNRLYDRVVVRTDAEKDKIKNLPEYKGKDIKVASDDDILLLKRLSKVAQKHMSESSDPKEKAIWQELAALTTKDDNGHDRFNADTKQVQDALIDLATEGRLNYSEQQAVAAETGMSMSQVRHAFHTYGFEAPHPAAKRAVNGLIAAAPVAATMGLSYILTKNKSHAQSHAESTAEAHSVSDATQTTVVNGEVTAEVPGQKIHVDFPTGEEYNKVIQGKSVTEYYEAIATANAHAEAHAKAFASATAACEAVAALSPAALIAAPALAFLAGFAKSPVEKGATKSVKPEKLAEMVNMYTGNKNKNIGNQIVQMAGHITGDEAIDRSLIAAVLRQDIGSQNTIATTRELRMALAHLDAIKNEVDKFKKLPPPPPSTSPAPTPAPTPAPKEYHADGNNVYIVEKNDILGNIVRAKYPSVNPNKAMQAIKEANGLKDINSLRVGQALELPEIDGVKPSDADAKKHIGGKRIKFNPTKTDAQEKGAVYEGKAHSGPHNGETVINTYTGPGAKAKAQKEADELNRRLKQQ